VGAALLDLALENRIDIDQQPPTVLNAEPLKDGLLDPFLTAIVEYGKVEGVQCWVQELSRPQHVDMLQAQMQNRLVARGMLERRDGGRLTLSNRIRQRRASSDEREEVKARVWGVLFCEDIPEPREILLIGLIEACRILDCIIPHSKRDEVQARAQQILQENLYGHSVMEALRAAMSQAQALPLQLTAKRERREARESQPKVSGLPLAGNALSMAGDLRTFFRDQYLKLGPVFRVRVFSRTYTVLAGAEANVFVQRKGRDHLQSGTTYAGLTREMGAARMIIGMDGPDHFRLRKVLRGSYSRGYILERLPIAIKVVERAIEEWLEEGTVPVTVAMKRIITEQLGHLCANMSAGPYLDDLILFLDRLLVTQLTHQRPEVMLRTPRMRQARARMEEFYEKILQKHDPGQRAACITASGADTIDDVLATHCSDPQFMPETDLMVACIGPFFAGAHTSAHTSAFVLYNLLEHPDLLACVRAEAEALFVEGADKAAALRKMDVTRRVVMETLRLYPIVNVVPRKVVNSFTLAGHRIPAGSSVMFAITVPHFLDRHFPDADRFDVDRYCPPRNEHRAPGAYVPFGVGTHRCLGGGLAEEQVVLTVATILHYLEVERDPLDYKLKINNTPLPAPDGGFRVRVARR